MPQGQGLVHQGHILFTIGIHFEPVYPLIGDCTGVLPVTPLLFRLYVHKLLLLMKSLACKPHTDYPRLNHIKPTEAFAFLEVAQQHSAETAHYSKWRDRDSNYGGLYVG